MDVLVWILILAMETGAALIVWRTDDEFSPTTALAFAVAIVITLALFAAFGDLSELDNQVTP